jgi:NADH dehydrogenase FAD-containing subunit
MENIQRVIIVGTGQHGIDQSGPPYHFHLDAVLIDRSQDRTVHPLVYQLSQRPMEEALVHNSVEDFLASQKDAFIVMGEVTRIDRKDKRIYLADGHTITYNYLIMMSGGAGSPYGHDTADFMPGVQALMDALRMHRNLLDQISAQRNERRSKRESDRIHRSDDGPLKEVIEHRLPHPESEGRSLKSVLHQRQTRVFQIEV